MKKAECRELNYYMHSEIIDYIENKRINCLYNRIKDYRAVKLSHRRNKNKFVIIHECTKNENKVQMTYFDENGPVSDVVRDSMQDLIANIVYEYNIVDEFVKYER